MHENYIQMQINCLVQDFSISSVLEMEILQSSSKPLLGSEYIKGIKNGCPCIVEIRGTQGCALVGDPARAVGECRDVAKAQP